MTNGRSVQQLAKIRNTGLDVLVQEHDRFARLIAQGMANAEACRIVGINRRTGTRWRFGRTILNTAGEPVHYPPVRIVPAPRPRHPRYLSLAERARQQRTGFGYEPRRGMVVNFQTCHRSRRT